HACVVLHSTPPSPTRLPYTTLFRSCAGGRHSRGHARIPCSRNRWNQPRPAGKLSRRPVLPEKSRQRRNSVGAICHWGRAGLRAQRGLAPRRERWTNRHPDGPARGILADAALPEREITSWRRGRTSPRLRSVDGSAGDHGPGNPKSHRGLTSGEKISCKSFYRQFFVFVQV